MRKLDAKVTSAFHSHPLDAMQDKYCVTATTSLHHLMDTYATMEFQSKVVEMLAQKFVDDNYARITSGINFEAVEASVLELVKKKFADLLKVEEPRKSVPSILYSRETDGSLKEIRRYGSGSSGG